MKMTEMCSNCNNCVDHEGTTASASNKFDDIEIGKIRVWDAIAYVYRIGNISLDDFQRLHFKNIDQQEKHLVSDFKDESLEMCDLCLSLLSVIYKTFKQFESLTSQASFIQNVQNTYKNQWNDCTKVIAPSPSFIPVSSSLLLSSLQSENGNEDLFHSFNFDDDHSIDEPEECFTKECKYDTLDPLIKNELPSVPVRSLVCSKMSLGKISKQLVVEIEKMSEEDVESYTKRKRIKTDSSSVKQRKNLQKCGKIGKQMMSKQNKANKSSETRPLRVIKATCKMCNKGYTSLINLRHHMKRVHKQASEIRPVPVPVIKATCKLCNKGCTTIHGLKKHLRKVHKQTGEEFLERFYKTCEICGLTMQLCGYKVHMEIHGPREPFKCNTCGREFLKKISYDAHLLTHSENFTPYLCRHCGMTLNDKIALKTHEKRHDEHKKFSCTICSKKFFNKADLERHAVVHSEERKFICDECGIIYKLRKELGKHKKIHKEITEKGKYSSKCEYCGKLFKHSFTLRQHLKIHGNNYKCSFCDKICNYFSLRKHENLHRRNPDYKPRKTKTWKSDTPNQLKPTEHVMPAVLLK